MRGFFGVGVFHLKNKENLGTLYRSAYQLGAAYIFTIGKRYDLQHSDTYHAYRHIPLYHYETLSDLVIPHKCRLVGIEMGGVPLATYKHPQRAIYLLGAEDNGLSKEAMERCHEIVSLQAVNRESYNVSVAGSIVMWHRIFGNPLDTDPDK